MKIEIRGDNMAEISGYVNVTEKKSRPVITPHGKVVEEIEPRAFAGAIERAGNVTLSVDHDDTHIFAETRNNTLTLTEDDIGLHADVQITDPDLIALARKGKIRGWSFGMYNVADELEPRAEDLPLRKVKALDLDHVSLIVNKLPVYSATSIEVRADGAEDIEIRARADENVQIEDHTPKYDNTPYRERLEKIKNKKWR